MAVQGRRVLLALVVVACFPGLRGEARAAEATAVDFETAAMGSPPDGFATAVTGGGGPVTWRVIEDPTAPRGPKVLAQTSTDKTSARFPLCIYDRLTAKDVAVSVAFKPVSGTVDQAAGLVARFKDQQNYYIVRANALENNVRLYKVERGQRHQFAGVDVHVPAQQWQTLALEVRGTHFWVRLNDRLLFEADDTTFKNPGKVGLWTKADSVSYFDNLTIMPQDTR
jgi:hypothetical protein